MDDRLILISLAETKLFVIEVFRLSHLLNSFFYSIDNLRQDVVSNDFLIVGELFILEHMLSNIIFIDFNLISQ